MIKKRSKAIALMTSAAMLASFLSAVPSISAEGDEKTTDVTLSDWTETLDYSDTDVELSETTVTLTLDQKGTLYFNGIYTEYDSSADPVTKSFDDEGESGGYQFSFWDSKSDIVSAINQKEGLNLTDDSFVEITDLSINYSWEYTSNEEERVPNIIVWPYVSGEDANGNEADGGTDKYHNTMSGSGTINAADCGEAQSVDIIRGFSLNAGASTNNPDDVLEFSWDSVILTVRYSETSRGGWKSLSDDSMWKFERYTDDQGTIAPSFEELVAAIKEQTGDTPADWSIKINDISADYEWTFNTSMENPEVALFPYANGVNDNEEWSEADLPDDDTSYQFTGKTGSSNITARDFAGTLGKDITNFMYMQMDIGAYTDNPKDTLTLKLTNITFNVTYQTEASDDNNASYLTYEELQGANYVKVGFNINKKGECGHENHVSDNGVDYTEGFIYCPWPFVYINRITSDGGWSDTFEFYQGSSESGYLSVIIPLTDIIATTGALSEGEKLRFSCNDQAVITELEASSTLPNIDLGTGSIIETTIEEGSDWDNTIGGSVPNGKPDIMPSITIASFDAAKSFEGYEALKIEYTLKNPGKCSGIVVILHGWEDDSVGWDMRYYEANSSGSIIIDLSDMQDKTFHNIYVGPAALTTAQIGDSFTPCFEVTYAAIISYCKEEATAQIDPIELPETPVTDDSGRKTANVTIKSDWSATIDFSGVDTVDGEFRHLYDDETQSGNWYIDKYVNDNLNSEILGALKAQTGDTPCDWPFVINDITAVCEWELTTDGTGSGNTGDVQFMPNTCGTADVPEGENSWRDANNSEHPSYQFSERTGSCNISASRIAALSNVTDISDYFGMGLDIGLWSSDPSAKLTLRITSVKLNITYVPSSAIYVSYDELKDAKYVKIYADRSKITECGHDRDHIGDDGKKYFDDWSYCPWASVGIHRIDADGNNCGYHDVYLGAANEPTTVVLKSISEITADTGELSEGDVLEFSGTESASVTKVEVLYTLPDVELDPITIDEVTIEEAGDWDPELGEVVPNGKPDLICSEMMNSVTIAYKANDYSAIKINYTLENPDECSAIAVILNGWNEDGTGWLVKYYPVSGKSGTIVVDLSTVKDKTFQQIYAGVVAQPTAKIGDSFTPGFAANGTLMVSCTDEFTEEIDPVEPYDPEAELKNNIEIVNNIFADAESESEPHVLTDKELAAVEAVLAYDYSK